MEQIQNNVTFGVNRSIINNNTTEAEERLDALEDGLDNVDNTADINKPLSQPQSNAIFDSNGKFLVAKLPDAALSPDQFEEYTLNGSPALRIKESYLIALIQANSGGTTYPQLGQSSITFGTSTSNSNILNWSSVTNATSYVIKRSTSSVMSSATDIYSGANTTFTDTGLSPSTTYYYTVTASAANYTSSTSPVVNKATAASSGGGGTYTVEKRVLLGFKSEYNGAKPVTPINNAIQTTGALLATNGGFTSQNLVDTAMTAGAGQSASAGNNPTGITLTNTVGFPGAQGQINSALVEGSAAFPNDLVNIGWSFNSEKTSKITLNGLNPSKYYQLYFLLPTSNTSIVRGIEINGVTKAKGPSNPAVSSFGGAGTGLADPEFIVFNNVQGSSIEIGVKVISGGYSSEFSMMAIEETNIAKV